jgi:hypothetical protein
MEITITASGSPEEVGQAFKGLAEGILALVGGEVSEEHDVWSRSRLELMWGLITDGAKGALKGMANHPDGLRREALLRDIGVDTGYTLAGYLASVGFACNRLQVEDKPYEVRGDLYVMDGRVAEVIRSL